MPPLVSVIVPTFNCRDILYDCLESIKNQEYPNKEIIVVDSFSRDGTAELAKDYATVYSFGPTPSQKGVFAVPHQRNYGVSRAHGEYVYWFDSDMRMQKKTLEQCVQKMQITAADALIVPEESYGEGFWARCRRLEKNCYNASGRSLTDAARFIRKEVWDAVGGLDATLGGNDDYDLQLRLDEAGYKTVKLDSSILHYEGQLRLSRHLRKKFIYGKTAIRYFRKHRDRKAMLVKQYSVLRPDFFANAGVLRKDPLAALGMITMKVMEYSAALGGLLYSAAFPQEVQIHNAADKA